MWSEIVFQKYSFKVPSRLHGADGNFYAVQDQIGIGGNAVVCECANERDGTTYAIKFLTNRRDSVGPQRFQLETNLLENLCPMRHDHLIRFVTRGTANGSCNDKNRKAQKIDIPFVVMERANGSLFDFIKENPNPIAPEIYIAQFRGLVSGLVLLHRHAIHRDIKPENILVVGERWVISDFGLCMPNTKPEGNDLTQTWKVPGPRFWMSPEANNRSVGLPDEITFASDVFQLAAVFWWVVNRRHPSGILTEDDWSGHAKLFSPIAKALQHSTERRFHTAADFSAAVVKAISL